MGAQRPSAHDFRTRELISSMPFAFDGFKEESASKTSMSENEMDCSESGTGERSQYEGREEVLGVYTE